jgi:CRP-like cAMP-binding protein
MHQPQLAKGHRANRLLAALEPDDLAYLEPHLEVVSLLKGTILYDEGQALRHAYFPHDTIVSLVSVMEDGTSPEMTVFGSEAVVGLVSAIVTQESIGRYIVDIPGTASRIDTARMHEAISTRPNLRRLILHYTEMLFTQLLQTVACNAVHSAEARCSRWILSTRNRLRQDTLPLTHEFLSQVMGVQRSTVSAVMGKLQRNGLIKQERGGITVTDHIGLERTACECYNKVRRRFDRLLPQTKPKG